MADFGKYTSAFFSLMRERKKRAAPDPRIAAWAEQETRPALRELFALFAVHDPGAVTVGDLTFWNKTFGGRVPQASNPDADRADVVCIGATHGGDLFVVAAPGAQSEAVTMIVHDEGFCEGGSWADLERFLEGRVVEHHERMQEDFPDDEDEWKTDLDPFLAGG